MTKIEQALHNLRWKPDTIIVNYEGDSVWLREKFSGCKRVGISDCCLANSPCEWHKALGQSRRVV